MLKSHLKTLFRLPKLITATPSTRSIPFKLIRTKSSRVPKSSGKDYSIRIPYMYRLGYPKIGPFCFHPNLEDISSEDVRNDFSKVLNSDYLSDVDKDEPLQHEVSGRMFGVNHRPIISLRVENKKTHIRKYVHFIIDVSAPYTYMTKEVFEAFGQGEEQNKLLYKWKTCSNLQIKRLLQPC